jgi:hypothetical protein
MEMISIRDASGDAQEIALGMVEGLRDPHGLEDGDGLEHGVVAVFGEGR